MCVHEKKQKPEMGHIYKPITGFHEPVLFKSQNLCSLSLFFIDALSLRPQPSRDRLQSWWAQLGSPGSLSYNFQQDFTKCPPPQLIALCNVAKC